jgi:hypothetical protein
MSVGSSSLVVAISQRQMLINCDECQYVTIVTMAILYC